MAGCEYDNYDPPTSLLSGHVVYNNTPVGVRSNATQLELWQYTWDTKGKIARAKISVYIAQDGSYSARLFDGDYKIVRLTGAPWSNPNTDTLNVTVSGNTTYDVPVTPFYTITGETFTNSGGVITSTCMVNKVGTVAISSLTLYIGVTNIVDANNNAQTNVISSSGLTDLSTLKTNTVTLTNVSPTLLASRKYVYVRLGVQISGVGERFYTPVQKITLN
ncbi:MAG: DUF3823 domain-containing protein [Bacteroidales bacterium]|nr:DUF3823 domain-containing protein [Bacteroidales bacterium]